MASESLARVAVQDGSKDLGQSVLSWVALQPDRVPCDAAEQPSIPRLRGLPQTRDNQTLHAVNTPAIGGCRTALDHPPRRMVFGGLGVPPDPPGF
jgi:hypothetical protein